MIVYMQPRPLHCAAVLSLATSKPDSNWGVERLETHFRSRSKGGVNLCGSAVINTLCPSIASQFYSIVADCLPLITYHCPNVGKTPWIYPRYEIVPLSSSSNIYVTTCMSAATLSVWLSALPLCLSRTVPARVCLLLSGCSRL